MTLSFIDYLILGLYFAFVLGIGWLVKKRVSSADDFLTSGRSVPVWITSLAFVAANLGAQELIGMCDRILVMSNGEIKDCVVRADYDREHILRAALGGDER